MRLSAVTLVVLVAACDLPQSGPESAGAWLSGQPAPTVWYVSLHDDFADGARDRIATLDACGFSVESFVAGEPKTEWSDLADRLLEWSAPDVVFLSSHGVDGDGAYTLRSSFLGADGAAVTVDGKRFVSGLAADAARKWNGARKPFFWVDTCHAGAIPAEFYAGLNLATSARQEEESDGAAGLERALVALLCDGLAARQHQRRTGELPDGRWREAAGASTDQIGGAELRASWMSGSWKEEFGVSDRSREVAFLEILDQSGRKRELAAGVAAVERAYCTDKCNDGVDASACGVVVGREDPYEAYGDGACRLEWSEEDQVEVGLFTGQRACQVAAAAECRKRGRQDCDSARVVYDAETHVYAFECRFPFPRATGGLTRHSPVILDSVSLSLPGL